MLSCRTFYLKNHPHPVIIVQALTISSDYSGNAQMIREFSMMGQGNFDKEVMPWPLMPDNTRK